MDMFLGTIIGVGFNFPPRGWMSCNGQLLSISQNSALFALLGTQYGGDGVTTFGLPDLRGRIPAGTNQGITGRIVADNGTTGGAVNTTFTAPGTGAATVTLTVPNLPAHNHTATFTASGGSSTTVAIKVSTDNATTATPTSTSYLAVGKSSGAVTPYLYRDNIGSGSTTLASDMATVSGGGSGGTVTVNNTGSGTPLTAPVTVTTNGSVATVPPFQGVLYIICVEGIFPSRN
ncbi:phage tail protein [Janthinobacterium agaricidamnosum]|uniref:Phage Tail Collar domain protein n=1 Tax=Janthinobacterium agaricidamnosum NBRC 102515 = DSM 9628 TaxID=1349767 RepID=W0V8Y2_9BURK|nr:tail fiber protein [Janthinobacterium agaricidamnosum]CDG84040.1 phage Tail Collar domain protein [Janthinobacterium agaricidamnosum NBRC 102515 = DSM 9628]